MRVYAKRKSESKAVLYILSLVQSPLKEEEVLSFSQLLNINGVDSCSPHTIICRCCSPSWGSEWFTATLCGRVRLKGTQWRGDWNLGLPDSWSQHPIHYTSGSQHFSVCGPCPNLPSVELISTEISVEKGLPWVTVSPPQPCLSAKEDRNYI